MKRQILIIVCLIFSALFSGCTRELIARSIATVNATQGWEIKENCGFEECYPLVDYLKGEDISIRFDLFNTVHDAKGEHFSIRLTFDAPIDKICTYNPTNTILIYKRKRISPYRYVTHGTTKIDSNENRIIPFERYSTKIPRYESNSLLVLLFFSVENIPPNETFSLKINDFVCNGREIISPTVNFKEGLRN